MTRLNAKILKALEGTEHSLGARSLRFEESPNHLPAARQGGEGYAAPVHGANGERYMLKTYHLPTIERKKRMTFLSAIQLHELLPAFEAVPVAVISDIVTPPSGGPVTVEGYLAPFMNGETVEGLFNDGWDPALPERIVMAAQLCSAIHVLESGGLVHADLAMANVMVIDADSDVPELRLIDFDGFHHASVPKVPCSDERGGRGFGQDAYRHRIYKAMDDTVTVTSDRCAMAALAVELVVLKPEDFALLGRSTLLDQDELNAGSLRAPPEIVARWPEGWRLLQRAFSVGRPEDAPPPSEWYDALVRLAATGPESSNPAASSRRAGLAPQGPNGALSAITLRITEGGIERRVNLRGTGNSFAAVSQKLAWLSYSRSSSASGFTLSGRTAHPVFLRRAGKLSRQKDDITIAIERGDEIQWGDFEIQVG